MRWERRAAAVAGVALVLGSIGCGGDRCNRATCPASGGQCEIIADGCGGVLYCGSCDVPDVTVSLPPDPATIAPAIDRTVGTSVYDMVSFLFAGSPPVQTIPDPAAISPERAVLLRGRVQSRGGAPLAGVRISVVGHPELGFTHSRVDGAFDLVANGGGSQVVRYERPGFASVDRRIVTEWQETRTLPDVVMLPRGPAASPLTLPGPAWQVVQAPAVVDEDGARAPTILFPPGTSASLVVGTTLLPAPTITVRVSEFTVGPEGRRAMPGELPPASAYTWSADFHVDEAEPAGASEVRFSQPVYVYLENFLRFSVGLPIPSGLYDPTAAAWVPAPSGTVLSLVGITSGRADLDATGDGVADDVTPLGVSDDERAVIAGIYTPGQSVWRVPLSHFSTPDFNPSSGCEAGCQRPPAEDPPPPNKNCPRPGSIIGCQDQSLAEAIPVTGVPLTLRYTSQRVPGRKHSATVFPIRLSGGSVPPPLKRILLTVEIAGRRLEETFPPVANQVYSFQWDGRDAYGRLLQGPQKALVTVEYAYDLVYGGVNVFNEYGRGVPADGGAGNVHDTREMTLQRRYERWLGSWDANAQQGLGGWSLDVHHGYHPTGRRLYEGDGDVRDASAREYVIETAAGTGVAGAPPEGGAASGSPIGTPGGVVIAADGTIYLADSTFARVRRIAPDGRIYTFAGGGGSAADGVPATQAALSFPSGVAVAPDGRVYIAEALGYRVRRVDPDGRIFTVAGDGTYDATGLGDGGPATSARISNVNGIAVGPDGDLYIADRAACAIRRVGPDKVIRTVAGRAGSCGYSGDGGPAALARLGQVFDAAIGPDGSLYIADNVNGRVRRVAPDGTITTVAGGGNSTQEGDPATQWNLQTAFDVEVARDGTVYVADRNANRVRRVAPTGGVTSFAGAAVPFRDGGPPTSSLVLGPRSLAIGPDGSILIAEEGFRLRRIRPPLGAFGSASYGVSSEDGAEVYAFDSRGRHLATVDGLSGAPRWQFAYDARGFLSSLTDGDGNVTSIERNTDGAATAIVAPGGQRTLLAIDGTGRVASIANPLGETTSFSYSPEGLLLSETDPRGSTSLFGYDESGRLVLDQDAAGGMTSLARTETPSGYIVDVADAMGQVTRYSTELLPRGAIRGERTDPTGLRETLEIEPDGTRRLTGPDGTVRTVLLGPDPRYGWHSPVMLAATVAVPGGPAVNLSLQRTVTPAGASDPGVVLTLTDVLSFTNTPGRVWTTTWDRTTQTITRTSPMARQSVTTLDTKGRVSSVSPDPALDPIVLTRGPTGRLAKIEQGGRSWTHAYDGAGRMVSATTALGGTVAYEWDAADRLTRIVYPGGAALALSLDEVGNVTELTTPGGAAPHRMTWSEVGLREGYAPPGSGTNRREYDASRALDRVVLAGGSVVDWRYDPAGRPLGPAYPEATIDFVYAGLDRAPRSLIRSVNDGIGSDHTIDLTWRERLPSTLATSGAAPANYSYIWSSDLFLGRITQNSPAFVNHALTRDLDGLLTAYGPFAFDRLGPAGAASGIRDTSAAGNEIAFGYGPAGDVTVRTLTVAGTPVHDVQLVFDAEGRVASRTEAVTGTTWSYGYDARGRLVAVMKNGSPFEAYAYDANGNRTSRTVQGSTVTASFDAQDRIVTQGATAYQFDADGFLVARGSDTFKYSARGELTRAVVGGTTVTYSYDALSRRVRRDAAGAATRFFYGHPEHVFRLTAIQHPDGTVSTLYYDDQGFLWALDRTGAGGGRFYVATDQVGTPLLVRNAAGTVIDAYEYDSFGNRLSAAPVFDLPIGFAGGIADPLTGLVRFGLRDYDPDAGRWTTRDPILFRGGDPNLYAYAGNDPVGRRDPTGLAINAICVGGSFYYLFGVGGEMCIGPNGASFCVEVGVGFGMAAGGGPGSIAPGGSSGGVEVGGGCGPVSGSAGFTVSECGTDFRGCLSAVCVQLDGNGNPGGVGLEGSSPTTLPRCGAQVKFFYRYCSSDHGN